MNRGPNVISALVAFLLLLVVSPVLILAVGWISFQAGFPVLYRSPRIGFQRKPFMMMKLRTMRPRHLAERWPSTTVQGDDRIIAGGEWLRRLKIDELPQLINIIRGEMAFVGPRPEMPIHLVTYGPEHQSIFDILPGLTDLASVRFFDISSELVRAGVPTADPDEVYLSTVHAERMRLRLEYVQRKSFWLDAYIVVQTIGRLIGSAVGQPG